jgi:DAACS family dicarboxylate/amino acid:cation (Na+ or H+) symporter
VAPHVRILLGLALGAAIGATARAVAGPDSATVDGIVRYVAEPVGQLFLRLLLMTVVPLVVSSLVVGVAGIGDVRKLGRVGVRTFAYTIAVSVIAVAIGLTLANTLRPGTRMDPSTRDRLLAEFGTQAAQVQGAVAPADPNPVLAVVRTLVPANPLESMARSTPDMIGIMFFAIFFGVALTMIPATASAPVVAFFGGVFEAMAKIIDLVMRLAPIGVAGLVFTMTARFGFGFLASVVWFVGTVLLGLALHMCVVYPIVLRVLARVSPLDFFRRIRTVIVMAFSTSSSNATLPTSLRVSESQLGVPREIGSFVLTVGATANQNGTALFEGVAVLFLAQLAGLDLTLGQQATVMYLAVLGSIGTAGVPAGSIPFVVAVLATVGVNPALIAIILGVDRLLDMCRTTLNVVGDLAAAVYVARTEGAQLSVSAR